VIEIELDAEWNPTVIVPGVPNGVKQATVLCGLGGKFSTLHEHCPAVTAVSLTDVVALVDVVHSDLILQADVSCILR